MEGGGAHAPATHAAPSQHRRVASHGAPLGRQAFGPQSPSTATKWAAARRGPRGGTTPSSEISRLDPDGSGARIVSARIGGELSGDRDNGVAVRSGAGPRLLQVRESRAGS